MKYNYNAIGKRIKSERLSAEYETQGAFAEKMGYSYESRQIVANWENGVKLPHIDDLLKMCELFHCDLGYLLCEYDCKRHEVADVRDVTGLSEKAIEKICLMKNMGSDDSVEVISKIIEHKSFLDFIRSVQSYIMNFNRHMFRLSGEDVDSFAKTLVCNPRDVTDNMKANSKRVIEEKIIEIVTDINEIN